jgi:hypothetical protein
LAAGQPEDISVVLANFSAIAALLNGGLDDYNIAPGAGIQASKIAGLSITIPLVTALPGSPTDGQEVILVDSLTTPTYWWRLRYNAGETSTYKWEFVGGIEYRNYVDACSAGINLVNTGYTDVPSGPTFIVPRAGEYVVEFGMKNPSNTFNSNQGHYLAPKYGAAAYSDSDAFQFGLTTAPVYSKTSPIKTLAASDALKLGAKNVTTNYLTINNALTGFILIVRPNRVS